MKITFIGAGALGSSLAGFLAEAGNDVVLVDTWAAHVDAINSRGLLLREGANDRTVRIKAVTGAEGLAHADLVVVLVKSFATREAITAALPVVGEHTLVMSIQNGLGHEDILAEVVGRARVLGAKTFAGGQLLAPGHVIAGVQGKETLVGELDGRTTPRAQAVADVFSKAGLATRASDNIMGVMWEKLLINVSTAALTGITRLPYGPLGRVPEVEATALQAVAEAMAVARAGGVRLTTTEPLQAWTKATAGLPEGFKPSLLQSLEKGERTEIDFINGAVVAWGKRLGIPTPVNSTLLACVKAIEYAQSTLKDKP
jgi:2-dehydropantoate 2-reductase